MEKSSIFKHWEKLLGKKLPKARYIPTDNIDWVFELLGWKENARRAN